MSNEKNTRIVRGSSRFAGSQDKDISLQPLLTSDQRTLIQGDRNLVLNLRDQFDFEREYSTTYRLYGKIDVLYNNLISGETSEQNIVESMYFLPDFIGCTSTPCVGTPPAMIFEFIPPKRFGPVGVSQYDSLTAYQDNWVTYISYVHDSDSEQQMKLYTEYGGPSGLDFMSGDGIPFTIEIVTVNGKDTARITTPVPHGILPGEYIELQNTPTTFGTANLVSDLQITYDINGVSNTSSQTIFKVDFLGDEFANTEDTILNIFTKGVDPSSVPTNSVGTLKRIVNVVDPQSKSEYYIHKHKLITNPNSQTLDRTGFEFGIYNKKGRVFKDKKTPTGYGGKTVIKEEYKSYLWNCNLDINSADYLDNLNRPLTDLYLTIFQTNRNLMWHWAGTANSPTGYGWEWNFRNNGNIDPFIDNDVNPTNIVQTNNNGVDPLPVSGSTYRGAFVEYNPVELRERVISEIGHSLKFNVTAMGEVDNPNDFVKSRYKFQPHNRIPIRKLSNTITQNDTLFTSPQYAVYSLSEETFRWRSILPIEFYEDGGNGVSYPYLNDAHYPYLNLEFTIEPILFEYTASSLNVLSTIVDVCE